MRRDRLLLTEMLDASEQAQALVDGVTTDGLDGDRQRRDALLWNFTVLGEAATQVSKEVKDAHPYIPWREPIRLRNRIIHGYWSVDLDILVTTARAQLPAISRDLRTLLAIYAEDDSEG